MLSRHDTICAQATPAGEGGIAIIRISGEQAASVIARVFVPKNRKALAPRMLTFGNIVDGGTTLDEAMAVFMPAPHTYTREDVAEIHCHGSDALVRRILMLLLSSGCRMAEPGEFTYRACSGGRIDLAQAEAVMRMIRSRSERAMQSAVRQMEGGVSGFVRTAREEIVSLLALLSASTDFPDEVEETETAAQIRAECARIAAHLRASCDPRAGRIEDEGLRVVLCGRPNAGKSSLMNALLGGERAIVTDIPGTTRDTLTESLQIGGVRVLLTDTAGLRDTDDAVERIGVTRARKALAEADVRVLIVDASAPLTGDDAAALEGTQPDVIVLSKNDLPQTVAPADAAELYPSVPCVSVCAPRGEGLDELCALIGTFAPADASETAALSQARHVEAARRACASLDDACAAIDDGMPLDICAVDLSAALDALGEITGETMNERVIDEVFARFCVGK